MSHYYFESCEQEKMSKFEREGRSSKYPLPTQGFFLFPLVSQRTTRKIVLFLPVRVIAISTVIKIYRNSKLEVVNIHFQPEDFFFFPLVSQRTIRKIVLLFPVRVLAICTVIKKNRNSKLRSRSNGAPLTPRIFLLSTFITCFLGLWTDKIQ